MELLKLRHFFCGSVLHYIFASIPCQERILTLYHTILTFIPLSKKPFENSVRKGENSSFPFLTMLSKAHLLKVFKPLPSMPILVSHNSAANKDMSKILTNMDTIF